jgi:hypothetical protein
VADVELLERVRPAQPGDEGVQVRVVEAGLVADVADHDPERLVEAFLHDPAVR